jgi:hypothetical protein
MKIQNSPLQCQASFLKSLSIKKFSPKQSVKEFFSMSDYATDLSFDILEDVNETNEFIVRIEININNEIADKVFRLLIASLSSLSSVI